MGSLFYCDDVIGVVVSGFNRGSTLEYPAPYIDRWKSARDYDKLAEAYVNDESEPDDGKQKKKDWWATDVKVEFDKLKAGNPDVIGGYGLIIRTNLVLTIRFCIPVIIRNNIIYGHNMNDGSMFGSLKKYKEEGFWKENQYFTVYSETTAYRYRIFSYEDAVNGGDVYKVGYQPGEEYQKFIDQMIKDSDVDTGVKPQTSNKILTLSTCTGNGYSKRLAIHAVCIDAQTTDESKLKETGN